MRKSDCVEELDLDEGVLRIDVEIDVHHDVKDDNQGEDDDVRANALHLTNHVDGGQRDKHFNDFDVDGVDSVTCRVRSVQCLCIVL